MIINHQLNMKWLSWHKAQRSRSIAKYLKISLEEYYYNENTFKRHLFSSLWTLNRLKKIDSEVIFIHYSYLLLFWVVLFRIITKKKYIIIADCHNKALRRTIKNTILSSIYEAVKKWSFKRTEITIITNEGMIPDIIKYHKNYFILPDKIPDFEININPNKLENYCVFISSFAVDEPFEEIIEVARNLGNEFKIFWTGKKSQIINSIVDMPTNIIFTGFLDSQDYYDLLSNANCLIILTTEDNCLQCGAYEGLNAGVPMVISNNKASRDYFEYAAIYTKIDSQNITDAIINAVQLSNKEVRMKAEEIKKKRDFEFEKMSLQLLEKIKFKLENYRT